MPPLQPGAPYARWLTLEGGKAGALTKLLTQLVAPELALSFLVLFAPTRVAPSTYLVLSTSSKS